MMNQKFRISPSRLRTISQPDPRDGLAADAVRGGRGRLGRPASEHRRRQPVAEPRGREGALQVQQTGRGRDSGASDLIATI